MCRAGQKIDALANSFGLSHAASRMHDFIPIYSFFLHNIFIFGSTEILHNIRFG